MKKTKFTGSRGLNLAGVVDYPPELTEETPVLIICHGFRGGKDGGGKAVSLAREMARRGFIVLRFDFSGTGESEGDFAEATLSNYILDLRGAVDFAASQSKGPIFVLGRSLGGTTAICTAAGDKRISGICTWASPVNLNETFISPARALLDSGAAVLKIPEGDGFYLLNRSFFEELKEYDIIERVVSVSPRPLFVIHGTADETVSFTQGQMLYKEALEPKKKLFIEGADHRFTRNYEIAEGETIRWLSSMVEK